MDELDKALTEAIFRFPDISDTEKLTLTAPPAVLEALQLPEPQDDVDQLIASVGVRWPVRIATTIEAM